MRRYFKEVKMVDKGVMTPKEFTERIFGSCEWYEVWAAARIYQEDGGKRFAPDEFVKEVGVEAPEGIDFEKDFSEFLRGN